ncbi:MAG: hypothetical protein AVDCRST_MAG88-790, partial [uncultured Thermomicrobiales bacterium]
PCWPASWSRARVCPPGCGPSRRRCRPATPSTRCGRARSARRRWPRRGARSSPPWPCRGSTRRSVSWRYGGLKMRPSVPASSISI